MACPFLFRTNFRLHEERKSQKNRFIVEYNLLTNRKKATPYFSSEGFNHLDMFEKQDFSSGHVLMAKAAANLFGFYEYELSLAHLVGATDDDMFPVLVQALIIRKHGL